MLCLFSHLPRGDAEERGRCMGSSSLSRTLHASVTSHEFPLSSPLFAPQALTPPSPSAGLGFASHGSSGWRSGAKKAFCCQVPSSGQPVTGQLMAAATTTPGSLRFSPSSPEDLLQTQPNLPKLRVTHSALSLRCASVPNCSNRFSNP